ncbi:hypothetical protein B0H14DRAFT_2632844 [Mycena olivaceomarginata]|nr:hypothetical protein B0H14DRAFT_2632844 [Mycena olivaceomarginata]
MPLYGSLVYDDPRTISSNLRSSCSLPDVFLLSIRHKVPLPLHWWLDRTLQKAVEAPLSIPLTTARTVVVSPLVPTEKVYVVDVTKASVLFGADDTSASHLTPSLWRQAMDNLLAAYKKLCPAFTPASELEKHFIYFFNLDIFDDMFSLWFPLEARLRQKILANSVFSQTVYDQKIDALKSVHENAAAFGLHLQAPSVQQISPIGGGKRGAQNDGNAASGKQQRSGSGSDSRGPGAGCARLPLLAVRPRRAWLAWARTSCANIRRT